MNIIELKSNILYLKEYATICHNEWGTVCSKEELAVKLNNKIDLILSGNSNLISALGLIDNDIMIGFISLLKKDGDKRIDLIPWYGTMYVKEEHRGKGYSKILNESILGKAKELGFKKVYLKTTLTNYYEKFGAKFIEQIDDREKLYCIEI